MRWLSKAILPLFLLAEVAWASHPPQVLEEARLWALDLDKDITVTYFPCSIAPGYCARLGILGSREGFYKAYFTDGFVLTLTADGRVLESYYEVPEGSKLIFKMQFKLYADMSEEEVDEVFSDEPSSIRERMKARIRAMREYAKKHGEP